MPVLLIQNHLSLLWVQNALSGQKFVPVKINMAEMSVSKILSLLVCMISLLSILCYSKRMNLKKRLTISYVNPVVKKCLKRLAILIEDY